MIVLLSVAGALAAVAVAVRRMWGRSDDSPHDPDWGDWPPDQMAP